jgi:hypothetical protein
LVCKAHPPAVTHAGSTRATNMQYNTAATRGSHGQLCGWIGASYGRYATAAEKKTTGRKRRRDKVGEEESKGGQTFTMHDAQKGPGVHHSNVPHTISTPVYGGRGHTAATAAERSRLGGRFTAGGDVQVQVGQVQQFLMRQLKAARVKTGSSMRGGSSVWTARNISLEQKRVLVV